MKDDSYISIVFLFFIGLWSLNYNDTTQLIELKTVSMKSVDPSCIGTQCKYTKSSDITFTISRSNQFITFLEEKRTDKGPILSMDKLHDCVVVDKKNFGCKELVKYPDFIYFYNHDYLNTSTIFRLVSDYINPSGETLNFFEKYVP
jgi:hypothetical protein